MIAAYGAFQGWDGIFSFAYSHNEQFEPRRVDTFFDIKGNAAKLVHMPPARRCSSGATSSRPGRSPTFRTSGGERRPLRSARSARSATADQFGIEQRHALLIGVSLDLSGTPESKHKVKLDATKTFASDTGEIRWDVSQEGRRLLYRGQRAEQAVHWVCPRRTFDLGDVWLAIGPTRLDWATVSLVARDGRDFESPGRIIIAATGLTENTNAKLETLGDDRITYRRNWGQEPLLCEGVSAEVTAPHPRQPGDALPARRGAATAAKPYPSPSATAKRCSNSARSTRRCGTSGNQAVGRERRARGTE